MAEHHGHVLVIDSDQDIADITRAVLVDAGFQVSVLVAAQADTIRVAVGQLEPDCVLLDGEPGGDYSQAWLTAAWLGTRERQVPVIMFSVDQPVLREARAAASARAHAAQFAGVLHKPFDLDELVDVVARAVGLSVPFDRSAAAEAQRTARLQAKRVAAGARDIHLSSRREWASFRTPNGALMQISWWQRDGVYYVLRYAEPGGRVEQIGRFYELDAAIAVGMRLQAREAGAWGALMARSARGWSRVSSADGVAYQPRSGRFHRRARCKAAR